MHMCVYRPPAHTPISTYRYIPCLHTCACRCFCAHMDTCTSPLTLHVSAHRLLTSFFNITHPVLLGICCYQGLTHLTPPAWSPTRNQYNTWDTCCWRPERQCEVSDLPSTVGEGTVGTHTPEDSESSACKQSLLQPEGRRSPPQPCTSNILIKATAVPWHTEGRGAP